jgi:Protein of unknown function (DUF2946)
MFAALKQRHWLLQVVLATLLAVALLPTVSRVLAHWQGQATPWAEACTTMAMEPAGAMASAADTGGLTHVLEHCSLCSLHSDTPAVLPGAAVALPLLALSDGPPPLFFLAARTPHAWVSAQPRAPPTAS